MEIVYIAITVLVVLSTLVEIVHYLITGTSILRQNRKSKRSGQDMNTENLPPVSVIICARNEEENLKNFLPLVLEQEYADFEVIIVNDGSVDETEELIRRFQRDYPNLYITSLPQEVRIVCHKKLALTVGIKAAKHEIMLFTDADCRPYSKHWIATMVKNFTPETEFVIGYGSYYRTNGFIGRLTAYDTLTIAMQYLGFAAAGKPYMGVGRNMAYRKSTFFRIKGFAGFLHMASGDDDLLINSFGTAENTRCEVTLESKTLSLPQENIKNWYYQKLRHLSTSDIYNPQSRILLGVEPFFRGFFYLSIIAAGIFCHSIPYAMITVVSCFLLKLILQTTIVDLTAKMYKEKMFNPLEILLFDIFLPLTSLYILSFGRLFNKRIYWK